MGAPGLYLVAFLDSSFVPLPGITDILLIVMVTKRKEAMLLYAAAAVLGSLAGCMVMHAIGKKVSANDRTTVLPPDVFRRFENDAFWLNEQANIRGIRVV